MHWLLLLFLNALTVFGQGDSIRTSLEYTITKRLLSVENGFASHEVFCGVQDSSGFLWFGTRNGLNRFDGSKCLLFTRQRNDLQENKVVQLAVDDANRLFIQYGSAGFQLTTIGKVDVMDATTQKVKTLTTAFPNLPFKESDVYWITNDGTGEISFLTASPFRYWRYSSKKGFRLMLEMKGWFGQDSLIDYRVTGPVNTFIRGTAHLKLTNQQVQYVVKDKKVTPFRQHDVLRSLPVGLTERNELLITYNVAGDMDNFLVDKLTGGGQLVEVENLDQYHLNAVKGRYWYQVWPATDGQATAFYIATDALYLWNKHGFLKVMGKSELKGFENLFIYRLFPDKLGNLWLCTSSGVMQLTIKKNRFKPYFSTGQQSMERNGQARGILADTHGQVVANVWGHTFIQRDDRTQGFSHNFINYGITRHGGALYTGGFGLSRYDEMQKRFIGFAAAPPSEIWSMHSLNDSLLLLGCINGFSIFNSAADRFEPLPSSGPPAPEARFVYRFLRDKNKAVWAVAENGLYRLAGYPAQGRPLQMVRMQSPFLNALSLLDAWQDTDGVWWLVTNGEGLYRWDPKTNRSRQFNITVGFPSDVLYRIEPDAFNNLWISSDYGLIRFNRKSFSINTYTTTDGISHNEFNRTSSFQAADGKLYFGGLNGVVGFDPRDFKTDTSQLRVPLRVIAFNQFVGEASELVNKTTELLRNPRIVLEPDDKFFTLDFQLLDFTKDKGARYAYLIAGLDKNWVFINENSVRISGLPYGDYVLRVRAQNREGAWNKEELAIPLKVLKPVYLQWYFLLVVALLIGLLIYLFIRFRIQQLAREKSRLEETVSERTRQLKQSLSEQTALLLEKDVLMKEIHHRVKNNLQVISGLLELQGKSLTDEAARGALEEGRNRVRSIALIHQNLYQFENLSSIDLQRFTTDLCRQVQSVFQTEKKVSVVIEVPDVHLDIDSAVPLGLILNELLSNSFKYAFKEVSEGEIRLTIDVASEGRFKLVYSDNGPGLPTNFDLSRATTLGLQLVNDLSRQIGGRVHYQDSALFTIHFTNREIRKNQD
ncbi:Two-component sensor histidine kinase, contains HisKA and HATPase domains [Dyadobacter sp. SG02]|uniref:histidine kinase dimerization/phosphoacceptor domain -containing protein n=1 Tax=Dyadobacter sp. SG02 TaxID=1855291 RepID=UPI0008C157BE|nr:histidine kinase dimerization/phosphoacceptor domain -containing protein [Dyadobacter sp. SG02]SEI58011.1 Two-component sensor histidine kinase, contains HisKA and HATPase domains [Dyadobacter sp. SG02]